MLVENGTKRIHGKRDFLPKGVKKGKMKVMNEPSEKVPCDIGEGGIVKDHRGRTFCE